VALHLVSTRSDVLVARLGALARGRRWHVLSWIVATAAHVLVALLLVRAPLARKQWLPPIPASFELEPPRPLEPETLPEPPPARTDPAPSPAAPRYASKPAGPARAAPALSQSETPEQPVDLTDQIVTGTAASYAGGTTTSAGLGQAAARSAEGSTAGTRAPAGDGGGGLSGPDRSRAASIAGGLDWQCPFPGEADHAGIDRAVATIQVELDAAGRARRVSVVSDPGHGFGAAARRCALSKRWIPALDRNGNARASSATLRVRFER
jgi:periplasmic protein TonB